MGQIVFSLVSEMEVPLEGGLDGIAGLIWLASATHDSCADDLIPRDKLMQSGINRASGRSVERMQTVVIHSDGACHGNPGPGGWAAVLACGPHVRELKGAVPATTNNRMELQAAIEAFAALKRPCRVEFHTDSNYLKNGVTTWLAGWKRNGWRTKSKAPVKNTDLWRQLDATVASHNVTWCWVKGHAGHQGNERCDQLATEAIEALEKQYSKDQLKSALREFNQSVDSAGTNSQLSLA